MGECCAVLIATTEPRSRILLLVLPMYSLISVFCCSLLWTSNQVLFDEELHCRGTLHWTKRVLLSGMRKREVDHLLCWFRGWRAITFLAASTSRISGLRHIRNILCGDHEQIRQAVFLGLLHICSDEKARPLRMSVWNARVQPV
jgi:hypothetical protein